MAAVQGALLRTFRAEFFAAMRANGTSARAER
jgi:hypothetical protein